MDCGFSNFRGQEIYKFSFKKVAFFLNYHIFKYNLLNILPETCLHWLFLMSKIHSWADQRNPQK